MDKHDKTLNSNAYRGRRGFKLLALAILLLVFMLVLSFTPLAWIAVGSKDETYPELVFFFLGVPVSVVAVVIAGLRFWLVNRQPTKL